MGDNISSKNNKLKNFEMKLIYFLMLLPIVYSCETKEQKEYKSAIKNFESNKQKLISKYNAIDISNDSYENLFTIKYQKLFIDSSRYLMMNGYVYDISRIDSNKYKFIIIGEIASGPTGFISVSITNKEFYDYFNSYSNDKSTNGIFIIKVTEVENHINPKVVEEANAENDYSYISKEDDLILFKGDIIEYCLEPE